MKNKYIICSTAIILLISFIGFFGCFCISNNFPDKTLFWCILGWVCLFGAGLSNVYIFSNIDNSPDIFKGELIAQDISDNWDLFCNKTFYTIILDDTNTYKIQQATLSHVATTYTNYSYKDYIVCITHDGTTVCDTHINIEGHNIWLDPDKVKEELHRRNAALIHTEDLPNE